MKNFFSLALSLALLLLVESANAQHFQITRNDYEQVNISFTTSDVVAKNVKTTAGTFAALSMEDYDLSSQVGKPQLPMMAKLLEIPVCDSVIATVKNAQYVEVDASELGVNQKVMPAQPSYPKSFTGEKVFAKDQAVYGKNEFYSEPLVRVEKSGIMRDICLANIYVSPVAYNPVTNKFRICRSFDVEITYVNANVPATFEMKNRFGSPMFQTASEMVANPMPRTREEFNVSPIKYLIIAHSMFAENEQLMNFVNWKKRIGYIVELVYTNDPQVGTTTTSIKNYIKAEYDNATAENPAPTFLLFVGDVAQIPAFSSTEQNSHVTDLYYACWTAGDNMPDCFYGRFSATNANQLEPQIEKTLMYEQYTMPDPSYLGKAVLIAGTDGNWAPTHANGQINYIYDNYINETTTNHNYTTVYKHNYNCSSQAATIRNEIGAGVGWANYTAHGSESGWADPSFSTSHVSSMNNVGKYGVMIGNCCLTGKFNESTCFGEALLRAENKGAMAYIGASEVSYWNEDAYWAVGVRNNVTANMSYNANNLGAYDKLFHTHGESHQVWSNSLGGLITGGNMAVQVSSSSLKKYYWEIYHVFGDASIKPYLGIPSQMEVVASDVIIAGYNTYSVTAVPYAYVALTHNNELVAATFADANGEATLTFEPLTELGDYELAVTAQNYIQYFKNVSVIAPSGPYVVVANTSLQDVALPGSSVRWNLSISNLGVADAANVSLQMTSQTPGYEVSQGTATYGQLAQNASADIPVAFTVQIPQNAQDMETAQFQITASWNGGTSSKSVILTVVAPNLHLESYVATSSTGATSFQPGDDLTMDFTSKNIGHATVMDAMIVLTCNYSGVTVNTPSHPVIWLENDEVTVSSFDIHIAENVETVSVVPLYLHTLMGQTHTIDTVYLTVGTAMETFETNDFSQFNWTMNSNPWAIVSTNPYAGSYCARSKSGLGSNQKSQMSLSFTAVMDGELSFFRKVSSEAGYDMFHLYIDGADVYEESGDAAWAQVSFPVAAGNHTIKFSYEKDYSQASGSDCAWIDNIVIPGLGNIVEEDVIDALGIADVTMEYNQLVAYPNPTTGSVVVRYLQDGRMMKNVAVYDVYGKLLKNVSVNALSTSVDLSECPAGVYLLKVTSDNQSVTVYKIVKK